MKEEFLHYIWQYRLTGKTLKLAGGEDCMVKDPGMPNTDSGPDFFNARVRTGNTTWAGNVEIHVNASEWFEHNHHKDKAYDNIILHVVYNKDAEIKRTNGELIPTLELKDKFNAGLYERYSDLMSSLSWIPCEGSIHEADRFILNNWLDRMLVERLEKKGRAIEKSLKLNGNNWEQAFYIIIARNFGFRVNALPFELLAGSLPLAYLAKHKDNKMQIEALLFGQAGLLKGKYKDEYPLKLQKEYAFLRKKFMLSPIDPHLWRFMRLRPSNFPTIRLSQFADLIHRSSHLFSKTIEADSIKKLVQLFDVSASEYWETHYRFGKTSAKRRKILGKSAIYLILINTVIPFMFIFGKERNNQILIDRSVKLLDQLPGENNSIIRKWQQLGMSTRTAFSTQALLQLRESYCSEKKCLSCAIGNNLLKRIET